MNKELSIYLREEKSLDGSETLKRVRIQVKMLGRLIGFL
jgi:hypothetical protein